MQNPFLKPRRVRYFTPQEANSLLPEIAPQLNELAECVQRYRKVIGLLRTGGVRGEQRLAVEADELRGELQELLDDINDRGVEVKGIRAGQLDFPALRNGQEVYLCWRQGEGRLEWWYPVHGEVTELEMVDYEDLSCWEWCS